MEENILKKANQKRMLGDMAIEGGNFTTAYFKQVRSLPGEPRRPGAQLPCSHPPQPPFLSQRNRASGLPILSALVLL